MSATPIDGSAVARELRAQCAARVAALSASGVVPGLAVVIVGDDPASRVYVRNKARACAEVGVRSEVIEFPADTPQAAVAARIGALNDDPAVHGILLQLPLPAGFDAEALTASIRADKDVDGFHPYNLGELLLGRTPMPPCTPAGVMALLRHYDVALDRRHAVVVGRSNIVGKPMALLLLQAGATVTVCHSRTPDLAAHTRAADVLVVAVGRPRMIGADAVKPGAAVIDVGINRLADGRLVGDVDFDPVAQVAGYLTPVPGGVGPMTIAMLLANTLCSAERFTERRP